jgi:hypothetical protein
MKMSEAHFLNLFCTYEFRQGQTETLNWELVMQKKKLKRMVYEKSSTTQPRNITKKNAIKF